MKLLHGPLIGVNSVCEAAVRILLQNSRREVQVSNETHIHNRGEASPSANEPDDGRPRDRVTRDCGTELGPQTQASAVIQVRIVGATCCIGSVQCKGCR